MHQSSRRALLALLLSMLLLAACGGVASDPPRQTVIVEVTGEPERVTEIVEVTTEPLPPTATPVVFESFTTPHPILGDVRVRQALAYCTDRLELVESVYPYLSADEQSELVMDSFVPPDHWAFTEEITTYPFDPEEGNTLLEEVGWRLPVAAEPGPGNVRMNAEGDLLALKLTTNDTLFRRTWTELFAQQLLENCGIQIIRTLAPSSWWFGPASGLQRRDFELGAFAWMGEPDPRGQSLYACDQVPHPENDWQGQNYMGWCNETASRAIIAANNSLEREERREQYALFQQEFTRDMASLPLFQRLKVQAATINLLNFQADPIEFMTANIDEWELATGATSIALGFAEEPAGLWSRQQPATTVAQLVDLISFRAFTRYEYGYQPVALTRLPTLKNGGAQLETVEVQAGDRIWSADGRAVELAPGVTLIDADGSQVTYIAGATVEMNQLEVTFEYVDDLTWEDGEPVTRADFELAAQVACDTALAPRNTLVCDSREDIRFAGDTSYTITYLPGALWPEYMVYTAGLSPYGHQEVYPAHQVIESEGEYEGELLADVPISAWPELPEVVRTPLSSGPYRLVEWQAGEPMIFEANPYYYQGEPAILNIVVRFIEDPHQALVQLLLGDLSVVDPALLETSPEVVQVLEAVQAGELQAFLIPSATWEHIDMNLFVR